MSLGLGGDRSSGVGDRQLVLKAALDRTVAALLLLFAAVWLLLIAVALRIEGPGPILSREPRLGRHGREFSLLRFRTSVLDVPVGGPAEPDGSATEIVRVRAGTRVGRVLHRCYADELPQLINVLRGDMSLVGPRPRPPWAAADDEDAGGTSLPVKPGLMGLHGGRRRGCGSRTARPTDLDDYVRNYSLGLDLAILRRALFSRPPSGHAG